jgi:bifunctional DNase/RNase
MTPVDILGLHVEAVSGTPVVLLRERDEPHRVLPIAIGGPEAASIALGLSGELPPRPLTHDLLAALVETLDAEVEHIEVTGVDHGTFRAELALRGPFGRMALDSRPSDAIALAVRVEAPLYASDAVLAEAGGIMAVQVEGELDDDEDDEGDVIDEEEVAEEVDRFRAFLAEVEPSEFEPPPDDEARPDDDSTPDDET